MRAVIQLTLLVVTVAGVRADEKQKPTIKLEKDGFPSGHNTPEGAACDLARAFIRRDAKLFESTCIKPFGGGKSRAEYAAFLKATGQSIKAEARRKEPSPEGPKSIGKVFAARHLSLSGPASYGHANFEFQDVMFVDVGVTRHDGKRALNRTLVIKDKEGNWYVHPQPGAHPLLSAGLNDEDDSKTDFRDVYQIKTK
jgi:hypothetical protein